MRIFVTGATGFIGSRVVSALLARGHQVTGLVRSEEAARQLTDKGATAQRGTLEDPQAWVAGIEQSDAVIHTAFDHDFSRFVENCEKEQRVIRAIGSVLQGSQRPLLITSGTGMGDNDDGQPALEKYFNPAHPNPRVASELEGNQLLDSGIDVRVVRLPQVHNTERQGLISYYISLAREKGVAAYIGEGENAWCAAHVDDVAELYVKVLEQGKRGERYHAVAEESITSRLIAETVATGLDITTASLKPELAAEHFGWFAAFATIDLRASGEWTRQQLNWQPKGPGLIDDLSRMNFSGQP
ncbi:SDR family oxidoreductase [Citrobacter sp. ku-bf4]|uniref:SDR family oxidoreductase n=1 Tax=Citrobacter TaxID=544 RepID=UPI00197CE5FB|nr:MULTISPECIES: SDR family oxidoreductase [Citrobacter]MBN6043442.1 SDR family oxidoreductase [Citrobacter sp. ku-bf4]MBS0824819.1 SDR family oxidoreductase [Citrobacter amalonaticus]